MILFFGSWLIAIAAMWPVAIRVAELGGKPVDLVLSDFLYLFVLLTPPRRLLTIPEGTDLRKLAAVRVSAVACILYCLALSLVGYATSTELSRVVSAVKFVKPLTFLLLGTYLAMLFSPQLLLRRMAFVGAAIYVATMATAFTHPAFPRCAWAQLLFAWETYGFPNSAMTFYGIMIPLVLAAADAEERRMVRIFLRGAAGLGMLLVVASLSRSSTIAMCMATTLYLVLIGRAYIPVLVATAGGIIAVAGFGVLKVETDMPAVQFLQEAVERRLIQTVEGDDPFSGRLDIWMHATELCAQKPVLGYLFEPFSNYSIIFDTPHQQYLEIFFKTGIIGSALYLWLIVTAVVGLWHIMCQAPPGSSPSFLLKALLAAWIGTLVGNLSQPNFTYSLVGNTLFLMLGLTLTRHGAAELVTVARITTTHSTSRLTHSTRRRAA